MKAATSDLHHIHHIAAADRSRATSAADSFNLKPLEPPSAPALASEACLMCHLWHSQLGHHPISVCSTETKGWSLKTMPDTQLPTDMMSDIQCWPPWQVFKGSPASEAQSLENRQYQCHPGQPAAGCRSLNLAVPLFLSLFLATRVLPVSTRVMCRDDPLNACAHGASRTRVGPGDVFDACATRFLAIALPHVCLAAPIRIRHDA